MAKLQTGIVTLLCTIWIVSADVYFHNPRGSNNRLDERGRARNNGNRLFDSQNNDRGGYNVGSLFYYEGSMLPVEWTNQHSCADANSHCELVIQYMCGDSVRDGITTSTIPDNRMQCENYNCNSDRRYGMHESYDYYLQCKLRQRNKGLFTADQNLNNRNRQTARNTRQNPGGTRRGFECPEERDYYPYWHPSPWKDVAVMTNNVHRCPYYQQESQNVKSRWACQIPQDILEKNKNKGLIIPNNKEDCQKFRWPRKEENGVKGEWKEFPSHGLPPPDCRETEFSRDNHLGNGLGGHPNLYNWTIPDLKHENCVLRIRYNISTNDYNGWMADASLNAESKNLGAGSKVNLADKYGFPSMDITKQRGYVLENNPEINLFGLNFTLRLAINTAQFGRTFQDRSHTFAVRERPSDITGAIHNLNVRGKRGNIVQVYPAVEYDFIPNNLEMNIGDHIHIQWTGSNTNNHANDGQGLAGSDRSNIVLLAAQRFAEGSGVQYGPGGKYGHYGVNYPMHLSNTTLLDLSKDDLQTVAYLNPGQFRGEMSELDDAGTYFSLPPRKATGVGTYHYMSTRNNNFSNRDQKGRIQVYPHPVKYDAVGWTGGNVSLPSGKAVVKIEQGVFDKLQKLRLEEWPTSVGENKIKAASRDMTVGDSYVSDFLVMYPQHKLTADGKSFVIEMNVDDSASDIAVYRSNSDTFATWTKVGANIDGGIARFEAQEGGVYVARSNTNIGLIVGVTITCLVVVVIITGSLVYFRRHPKKWQAVTGTCRYASRSLQDKV